MAPEHSLCEPCAHARGDICVPFSSNKRNALGHSSPNVSELPGGFNERVGATVGALGIPGEAAETQPLLGDQVTVPREAHWTKRPLSAGVGTVPLCRAMRTAEERGLQGRSVGLRMPPALPTSSLSQFPGHSEARAPTRRPQRHLAGRRVGGQCGTPGLWRPALLSQTLRLERPTASLPPG